MKTLKQIQKTIVAIYHFIFTRPTDKQLLIILICLVGMNYFKHQALLEIGYTAGLVQYADAQISPKMPRTDVLEENMTNDTSMRNWVLNEVKKAGLDEREADMIIQCESSWDNWKYNINTNGSSDFGLWMINSIHKDKVSVECRWNYKCSTKWAIEKRLHDTNWSAWVCSRKLGIN